MRICQIMLAKGFGGAERYYIDLSRALCERGHDVLAICHKRSLSKSLLEQIAGINVRPISIFAKWDPFAVKKVSNMITDFKPEVVQAHLARGAFIGGKVTSKQALPLLVHTHNFINMKYYKNVDKFIPATHAQVNYLKANGIAENNIRLIRNFSAFPAIDNSQLKPQVKKIVSHGRFIHKKGFDLLVRSFARLNDPDIELHIAGDGPEKQAVANLVSELNIDAKVHFPGWQDDIRSFLLQGDLFVLPSRDEPFGIALLEAMACGIPMVATQCHGPVEILDESVAYLCEVNNVDSLTGALETALRDPQDRLSKTQQALELFKERYSIDRAVIQFEELYREMLS